MNIRLIGGPLDGHSLNDDGELFDDDGELFLEHSFDTGRSGFVAVYAQACTYKHMQEADEGQYVFCGWEKSMGPSPDFFPPIPAR